MDGGIVGFQFAGRRLTGPHEWRVRMSVQLAMSARASAGSSETGGEG